MPPSTLRKRSLSDMQYTDATLPAEYNSLDYFREVLQLEVGYTESSLDEALDKEAERYGISTSRPTSSNENTESSLCESADTTDSHHRTISSGSQESNGGTESTSKTSFEQLNQPPISPLTKKRPLSVRRSVSFSDYDKYLLQIDPAGTNAIVRPSLPSKPTPSFSISSRRSYATIKEGLKTRLKLRRSKTTTENAKDDFKKSRALHTLLCSHNYCETCLRVLVTQASNEESKMPPRCCGKPISGSTIKIVMNREEQGMFLKSVQQFSTPWESRIFCPHPSCGEFIPPRTKIDPKAPFEVVCRKCRTRACSTCKRAAHAFGQDCPADWELDQVLEMGENAGWRRCYKCRTLVELAQGCSHITCRCKAQFCYICGAVWDPVVGCPNYCNGEVELERRRIEEEARIEQLELEKAAKEKAEKEEAEEKAAAEKRTADNLELNNLRARQINERDRFSAFERKMKWIMWTRHGRAKLDIFDRYGELQNKMKERHARTAAHLEDRQVAAEMELRSSLKQSERSVQIRLRHMEAYCDGLGRSANGTNPARIVTERDLRELGQQYNLRDDLERLHQSKINVMRDKQTKQMEHLVQRQEEEMEKLGMKQNEELDALVDDLSFEEEGFVKLFEDRRARLKRRWAIVEEIERKKLEGVKGERYAPMPPVEWVNLSAKQEGLPVVEE